VFSQAVWTAGEALERSIKKRGPICERWRAYPTSIAIVLLAYFGHVPITLLA
jgi:hypothetical protein